jgi:thiamine-phosphate pyrophosphorylase
VRVAGFYGVVDRPELAETLVAAGASVIQVRMKGASARELWAAARDVRAITRRAGVPLVVNDRLDVALAVDADGVHLGQDDLSIDGARAAAGGRTIAIGISTHSIAQAVAAWRAGADYIGFGPVFATSTKEDPDPVVGLDGLAAAVRAVAPLPVVAIGGIGVADAPAVAATGAAAACVISAVNGASDPIAAGRAIVRAFSSRP